MEIVPTSIDGAYQIRLCAVEDERGRFTRTFCKESFSDAGIQFEPVQCNRSFNFRRATLRGLHFQKAPYEESKLVECTKGKIFDVAVDLRRESPTYGNVLSIILSGEDQVQFYIPGGCAHGFITLEAGSEVGYLMGAHYVPKAAHGIIWNDPDLAVPWPIDPEVISEKDRGYQSFAEWESSNT